MTYKLIVFDWDGTLFDSAARIVSSFQGAARQLGVAEPTDDAVRNVIGLGLPEAIKTAMPYLKHEDLEPMRLAYAQHYVEIDQTPVSLFDQVETGLEKLLSEGFRLAVATGKSRRGLDRILSETGLACHFEVTRCADETLSKPHPLMLEQILSVTGLPAQSALMVGDTVYDLQMASRAAIDAVAVNYGVHSPARLQSAGPVHQVDSFSQFINWLLSSRG